MGQLSRRRSNSDLALLLHALDHQREDIESIVQLTTYAMQGTSRFHQAMLDQAADTLDLIEVDVALARDEGYMSSHKEQAIAHRVHAYLYEMLSVMQETDQDVYDLVANQMTRQRY
jgi:hypothetical protein